LGFGKAGVAELDVRGKVIRIRVIRPGFQQQHGSPTVCRQPAGQHTSRRSAADDHHVIFHGPSFTDIRGFLVRFGYRLAFLRL